MDSYRIKIVSIEGLYLTVIYYLYSTQVPDLPLKKNIAFQFITDAYNNLTEFECWVKFNDTTISNKKIKELLNKAVTKELNEYHNLLKGLDQVPTYTAVAHKEISELKLILDKNWELADQWEQEIYNGIEYSKTTIEAPFSTFQFKVNNEKLLKHLEVGLEWRTRGIWDRYE